MCSGKVGYGLMKAGKFRESRSSPGSDENSTGLDENSTLKAPKCGGVLVVYGKSSTNHRVDDLGLHVVLELSLDIGGTLAVGMWNRSLKYSLLISFVDQLYFSFLFSIVTISKYSFLISFLFFTSTASLGLMFLGSSNSNFFRSKNKFLF